MSSHTGTSVIDPRRGSVMPGGSKVGSKKTLPAPAVSLANQSIGKTTRMSISTRRRGSVQPGGEKFNASQKKPTITIMDNGVDVTPAPLLVVDPNLAKQSRVLFGGTGSESGGIGTPTDVQSQYSMYQQSSAGAPMSKPVWASGEESYRSSRDSITEDFAEPGAAEPQATGLAEIVTKHGEQYEDLSEADLEKNVDILLVETPTIWLLDLPGKCVEAGTDEAKEIKENNDKYWKLCKDRVGNDLYAERVMQTFDNGRKMKHVQTEKIAMVDSGSMATTWDMYDTFLGIAPKEEKQEVEEGEEVLGQGSRPDSPLDDKSVAGSEASKSTSIQASVKGVSVVKSVHGSMTTDAESVFAGSSLGNAASMTESAVQSEIDDSLLKSDGVANNMFIMERVVVQNIYQSKLAMYRGMPVFPDIDIYIKEQTDESESMIYKPPSSAPHPPSREKTTATSAGIPTGPHLEKLWSFGCEETKGYTVLCMSWNKQNPDILAVGYGQATYRGQTVGLVCCWCIKNIEYPERIYRLETGVTSVDFSSGHPNLLGVGTYDGSVCVYDVSSKADKPVLDNFDNAGKHTGAVWEVVWVERERVTGEDKGEILVSVSADGRVTQWSIRKGFESFEVMKLKKILQSKGPSKVSGGESLINRFSSGMGLAFKANDTNIYIAGTEDGHIHRCSCSYNEQFLATYHGHSGPVYKVCWSPFLGDVFLSASSDWSMKVWQQDESEPIMSLQPSLKAVTDVAWSPFSPTVFGCTTEDAVQIFNLEISTIDPVVTHPAISGKLTAFAFSHNSPCVLFGDSNGLVTVMKTFNVFTPEQEEAAVAQDFDALGGQGEKLQEVIDTTLDRIKQSEEQTKKREKIVASK